MFPSCEVTEHDRSAYTAWILFWVNARSPPKSHQFFLCRGLPLPKISLKCVHNVLSNSAHRQTIKHTQIRTCITALAEVTTGNVKETASDIKRFINAAVYSIIFKVIDRSINQSMTFAKTLRHRTFGTRENKKQQIKLDSRVSNEKKLY